MKCVVLLVCLALFATALPVHKPAKKLTDMKTSLRKNLLSSINAADASVVKAKLLELVQALPEHLLKQVMEHPTATSFVEVKADTCRIAAVIDKGVAGETCSCGAWGGRDGLCTFHNYCSDGQRYEMADSTWRWEGCAPENLPVDNECYEVKKASWHCCCRPAGSCLAPETEITMFNGSVLQIQHVQPGDVVRSASGRPAKVLAVDVAPASGRVLYPLGGSSKPFVSEDHFLVTDSGLAAVDLAKALEFEPTLKKHATRLLAGARLQVYDAQTKTISFRAVSEAELSDAKTFQPLPEQGLYNLVLAEEHTYIANNVVVSDMFPDLSQAPNTYKLLHWILRDNVKKVEDFFAARPGASKYTMKPLVAEISGVIDSFIAAHDQN